MFVSYDDHSFNESVHIVDTQFFKMFDFNLKEGNIQQPWPNSNSLIISETEAKKYFSGRKAIGNNLELQFGDNKVLFTVSGVVHNNPPESSIQLDFLVPFSNDHLLFSERMRTRAWSNIFTETYVLLDKKAKLPSVDRNIAQLVRTLLGKDYAEGTYKIHLQPIKSIHLDTGLPKGIEPTGNPKYAYIIATTGGFILLIACINFIILSVGYSTSRSLEVGVRKVLGAERLQLTRQFWGEAFLLTLLSVVIGLILAYCLFKPFKALIGKDLSWQFDLPFFGYSLLSIVLIAIITGIYPALVLSKFNAIEVLKGQLKGKSNVGIFRKSLITGQFIISITMIICTLIVSRQLKYIKDKYIGFDKENVVIIPTNHKPGDGIKLAGLYQSAVIKLSDVIDASAVMYGFDETPWAELGFRDEKEENRTFQFNSVDTGFLKTMNIKLVAGSNFFSNDDSSVLVNETFVRQFGIEDVIGKRLPGPFGRRIGGVIRDFNVESLHTSIKPLVLATNFESISRKAETMLIHYAMRPRIVARLRPGNIHAQMENLRNIWQKVAPGQEFDYRFLDEAINMQYKQDERTGLIVDSAAALSIFISCMGLFGLVTLSVSHRTKEIAVRKVLGASVAKVIALISKGFLQLVIFAAFISIPLAWLIIDYWLNDFAYRVELSWWIFCLAIALVLLIAFVTICIQAFSAANANPIKGMRSE
jgi:putative ABC transport system permease protein